MDKTGWSSPELMQDGNRGLSRWLSDPLGARLRAKPVSVRAAVVVLRPAWQPVTIAPDSAVDPPPDNGADSQAPGT